MMIDFHEGKNQSLLLVCPSSVYSLESDIAFALVFISHQWAKSAQRVCSYSSTTTFSSKLSFEFEFQIISYEYYSYRITH